MKRLKEGYITTPRGFLAGGINCGIKDGGTADLGILISEREASVAGVFTQNRVKAAPVIVSEEKVKRGRARGVIVNSGNANACTGEAGIRDAHLMCEWAAEKLGLGKNEMLVCSTGIIGEPLPMKLIERGIKELAPSISKDKGREFATAILTTDKKAKEIALEIETETGFFYVGGAAKGAGMIHPHMATMLAFITTDIKVDPFTLKEILDSAVGETFNRISVDGDRSTNDTVLAFANGLSGLKGEGESLDLLEEGISEVCRDLALKIVEDGEGATKVVKIRVKGASSVQDAEMIARSVANSLLVKTALFGEDPNWGRIAAAAGYSGAQVVQERLSIQMGEVKVVESGAPIPGAERLAQQEMRKSRYPIIIDVGLGKGEYHLFTCDLSYDYIRINTKCQS